MKTEFQESSIVSRIETGTFEVIESGILILADKNSSAKFFIEDLLVEIAFNNIDPVIDHKLYLQYINDKHIQIICKNFNPNGEGLTEPAHLFSVDNIDIYIKFIAFDIENLPRIIYTFYKKKEG